MFLFLAFGFLILLIGGTIIKKAKAEVAAEKIRILSALVMADIKGNIFRTDQVESGTLFITFSHPERNHCKYVI